MFQDGVQRRGPYTIWVEGEHAGEFAELEAALAEAALCALGRDADALVTGHDGKELLVVSVTRATEQAR